MTADNPLGLNGFEFVEFTGPDSDAMIATIERLGFVAAHRHPDRDIVRFKQGNINLLVNREASQVITGALPAVRRAAATLAALVDPDGLDSIDALLTQGVDAVLLKPVHFNQIERLLSY